MRQASDEAQVTDSKRLPRGELFGWIAGIIGLIADIISLGSLFVVTQGSGATGQKSIPTLVWFSIFFAMIYSHLIVSYYVRSLFYFRLANRSEYVLLSYIRKINRAILVTVVLITVPFLSIFLYILSTETDPFSSLVLGTVVSFLLALLTNYLARFIFEGVHPEIISYQDLLEQDTE